MAKQGQMDAVKIMAKDLVRTRRYVKKFMLMRANIQAVSLKIQTLKSQNAMAQAMNNMNKQMKLPEIQKIMMEFEKQSEIMDMKEEMMSDTIDDALGDEEDEEESDAIVNQVLDELGLQMTDELAGVAGVPAGSISAADKNKKTAVAAGGEDAAGATDADVDLQARLDDLRRE